MALFVIFVAIGTFIFRFFGVDHLHTFLLVFLVIQVGIFIRQLEKLTQSFSKYIEILDAIYRKLK